MPYEDSPENGMSLQGPSLLGAVRPFGFVFPTNALLAHKKFSAGAQLAAADRER